MNRIRLVIIEFYIKKLNSFFLKKKMNLDKIKEYLDNGGDPSYDNNFLIKYLSMDNDSADIIKLLLNDPRVDPQVDDNYPIRKSIELNCKNVVKILLSDDRVNPFLDIGVIETIIINENIEMGIILLNDHRITDELIIYAFQMSVIHNKYNWVKYLMDNFDIDPSIQNNLSLMNAVNLNNIEIVDLLLRDSRVNPFYENIEVINKIKKKNKKPLISISLNVVKNRYNEELFNRHYILPIKAMEKIYNVKIDIVLNYVEKN